MTIKNIKQCDEESCMKYIAEGIIIEGNFTIRIGSNTFSSKHTRLDFCDKTCFKKFIDDMGEPKE